MELWCDKRLTVTVDGPTGCQKITLDRPYARVGSHPNSEILIPDIEKRTLYLHATEAGVFCLDLRGQGLSGSQNLGVWLAPDAHLNLGTCSLTVALEPSSNEQPLPAHSLLARGLSNDSTPVFRVTCKDGPKVRYRLRRQLTLVGRYATSGLNLSGATVSSPHCVLYRDHGRIWCIDLLSGNGTYHNGQRFDVTELNQTDRLRVGEFRLVYRGHSQKAAPCDGPVPVVTEGDEAAEGKLLPFGNPLLVEGDLPGTVRLDLSDTVAFPEEESALPDAKPPAPAGTGESRAAVSGTIPFPAIQGVSEKLSVETSAEIKPTENSLPAPADPKIFDDHGSRMKLLEQEALLIRLREELRAAREEWGSEKLCLRQQLTEQAATIHRLQEELNAAQVLLDQRSDHSSPAVPIWTSLPEQGVDSVYATNDFRGVIEINERTRADKASTGLLQVSGKAVNAQMPASTVDPDTQAAPQSMLRDRRPVEAMNSVSFPEVAPQPDLTSQRADRETIEIPRLVHSTMVLQERTATGSQLPECQCVQPEFVQRSTIASCASADLISLSLANESTAVGQTSPGVDEGSPQVAVVQKELRDDLSVFVNNRILEIDQTSRARMFLIWSGLAVGITTFVGSIVAGWWIWNR